MNKYIDELKIQDLLYPNEFKCVCGKTHRSTLRFCDIGSGTIGKLPERMREYGFRKAMVYADRNTWKAAGREVDRVLEGIPYILYTFADRDVFANESSVGQATLNFNDSCDVIIAVGTGTINDISKTISRISGKPYIIVGTAPSMDGFASDTSSMVVDGLKLSVSTTSPLGVIIDTKILKDAPSRMICAGVGDLAAKYISICEWKISHIINDEYYCPHVANIMLNSLKSCMDNLEKLKQRDEEALGVVAEGLVLAGMAMSFAGVTRPASGMEHYFSHIWDMRALEFGYREYLHGEQVGVGTLIALGVYEKIRKVVPDREKAREKVYGFSLEKWNGHLREFLGNSSRNMILQEKTEGKYDLTKWETRIDRIIERWDDILKVINELPSRQEIYDKFKYIGAMTDISEMDISEEIARQTFMVTKDIRDKYIGTRLLFDLGLIDEFAEELF
ncbi:MAG: sn-glycerol-1-phosphate dehydrogenase [Clostridia bacterium]|nr:sn-glycerol-1-phosphate dehydrogenase [Clostridia bacterium]